MKTLFFECNMGATDMMLLSSLYDACEHKSSFLEIMNEAFAPFGITISANPVSKCGIFGTRISYEPADVTPSATVKNETEEHLNYLLAHAMLQHEQEHATVNTLSLPDSVKEDIAGIYQLLNEAATTLRQPAKYPLPFRNKEDASLLVNVAGCALLISMIAPEQIICSPLHIGNGFVKSGDTIVSVPAPLTADLLKGIPCYTSNITGALLDESNIAILKYFVNRFSVMPAVTIQSIGYGIGTNDFEVANYVRTFVGDTQLEPTAPAAAQTIDESFSDTDTIISLSCNIDDMTGEALSLATEILLAAGALDVYTTSIQMKKNRPGVLLTCLCEITDKEKFIGLFFLHTSTQEIRYQTFTRAKLESTIESRHSSYGSIRVKKSSGYGVEKEKPEFEDLKSIVLKNGVTIADIEFD